MSAQENEGRGRAAALATGADALTPLVLTLRRARQLAAAAATEHDAPNANAQPDPWNPLDILRQAVGERWDGPLTVGWFAVCVMLAADPVIPDSGGDPETDLLATVPHMGPWGFVALLSRAYTGASAARYVLDTLATEAEDE
ncbi:MAG: hypothetical protein OXU74_06540 [Gemmatimonadota bacterium]|nr:hypothetical protein [Gemmatimonadota bacterium]